MKNKLLLVLVALLGIGSGYLLEGGHGEEVVARTTTMPANPHIVYLTPPDVVHGVLTSERAQEQGMVTLQSWAEVRKAAQVQPLDALLVEHNKFAELSEDDRTWLRRQVEEGVGVVGVGIDIEEFSAALGLPNLRAPGEAPIPIGDDGYYLFRALLLGTPEDVQAMRNANWLERSILGEPIKLDTRNPLSAGVGTARGKLVNEQDMELLRQRLKSWIEYTYQLREEMASNEIDQGR
ncbi:MAG: hypothetical protein ACK4WM_10265 [Thermoflexales bacterium]